MKFGRFTLEDAEGVILAHSIRQGGLTLKKGHRLRPDDISALRELDLTEIQGAKLGAGDIHEDEAAALIGNTLKTDGITVKPPFTGRVNFHADWDGLFIPLRDVIDAINAIDEGITIATLPPNETVRAGDMIATVKIIPFAVAEAALQQVLKLIGGTPAPAMSVAGFRKMRFALIQTRLPGTKPSVLEKTVDVMRGRLAAFDAEIGSDCIVPHRRDALTGALETALKSTCDGILIVGASAITDRCDTIPSAITAVGGTIRHFGMPVDPGNLLLTAQIGDRPVLGMPGCVRSSRPNGADWVLGRICAGIEVTGKDIMTMGVGGLLKEIPSRPLPRKTRPKDDGPENGASFAIAAAVLAAGKSSRMGDKNKLLLELGGKPLVRHAVEHLLEAGVSPVVVVLGGSGDAVRTALSGLEVTFVENPAYEEGLSSSLKVAVEAMPDEVDGMIAALGDMPFIGSDDIGKLCAAFNPTEGRAICVPTVGGKRGNPVLWSSEFFDEIRSLRGDVGGKHLIGLYSEAVEEVPVGNDGPIIDVDTPDALSTARLRLEGDSGEV